MRPSKSHEDSCEISAMHELKHNNDYPKLQRFAAWEESRIRRGKVQQIGHSFATTDLEKIY